MMRWLYASPEVKEFVSDGAHMYSYIPEDGQLFITDIPPDDQLGTPVLFLAGKGKIGRDFEADYVQAPVTEGSVALRLTPVEGDSNYEYLVLTLDARTLQIIGLAARDLQGGDSSIIFSNLQENRGLTDNDFVFQIPNGIDVITDDTIH
jgi:outer membrane lipoprotein carrier protein